MRLNHIFPQQPLGRIVFCSTGIILMRLTTCPELKGVSHLIIDEVHARGKIILWSQLQQLWRLLLFYRRRLVYGLHFSNRQGFVAR